MDVSSGIQIKRYSDPQDITPSSSDTAVYAIFHLPTSSILDVFDACGTKLLQYGASAIIGSRIPLQLQANCPWFDPDLFQYDSGYFLSRERYLG